MADKLEPKGTEKGEAFVAYALVDNISLGQQQAPNPAYLIRQNMGTLYRSYVKVGQLAVRLTYGGAGLGCWKKRKLYCNDADTDLNVIGHESEPTSNRSYIAREFGEPL